MSELENSKNPSPCNIETQKSTWRDEITNKDGKTLDNNMSEQNARPVDTKSHENPDSGNYMNQSSTCLGDMSSNEKATYKHIGNNENTPSGHCAIQGSTISTAGVDQVSIITGDAAIDAKTSPGVVPAPSFKKDSIEPSAVAPGQYNIKQQYFQPSAPYQSPYKTIYDPNRHYARAYSRILGNSQTEKEQIKHDSQPLSASEGYQHFGSTSRSTFAINFTASAPPQIRHSSYGPDNSFPENFRFTTLERSGTPISSHHRGPPSPEHGGLRRFGLNDIYPTITKPVVIGRVVRQSRKRGYVDDDNEDFESTEMGRNFSALSRDYSTHDATTYSQMEGEYRGADSMHDKPASIRFRAPGADSAAKRYHSRTFDMEDDDYAKDGNYVPDDDRMQDSDSDLFVSQNRRSNANRSNHPSRQYGMHAPGPRRDADTRRNSEKYYTHSPESRPRAEPERYFATFGNRLEPSRYSGVPMPWGVASEPVMIDQTEVSDASLLKRNIARGEGKKICKRGYGASDPENIAIVNMKEFENMPFDEIARKLNDQRVKEGKEPSLSAVGVNSRYNRTAPLLFSAQGKEFVPLSKRRGRAKEVYEANKSGMMLWDDELDLLLVNCVKDVDAAKWTTVATLFEEKTGKSLTPNAAALRHSLL